MTQIFLIALSLAMDAMAVSISAGITTPEFSKRHAVLMGLYCGGFQFVMPIIGYVLAGSVEKYIVEYDHWIAFILLLFIGGKMLIDAFSKDDENKKPVKLTHFKLLVMAIATSIDALAVGITIGVMDVNVFVSAAITGVVAFILTVLGGMFGKKIGIKMEKGAVLLGGCVLIGIGIKILIEHLFF